MSMASERTSFMTSLTRGWSGIWMSPTMVSKQAAAWGKTLARRSSERVRWICGAMRLPFDIAEELQGTSGGPAPAVLEDGEAMAACSRSSWAVCSVRNWKTSERGKLCCSARADVDAVVGGGGLQLEVEAAAEAFAEGEAPGLVDAAAEGGVQDELHAAAFVEEALGDDGGFGGHGSRGRRGRLDDVGDELQGAGLGRRRILPWSQAAVGG